jgi:hypothetical protein
MLIIEACLPALSPMVAQNPVAAIHHLWNSQTSYSDLAEYVGSYL